MKEGGDELCQVYNALITALSLLACPLNIPLFSMTVNDLIEGISIADPATCYSQVVLPADMDFSF